MEKGRHETVKQRMSGTGTATQFLSPNSPGDTTGRAVMDFFLLNTHTHTYTTSEA